jgi:hypothetical protein
MPGFARLARQYAGLIVWGALAALLGGAWATVHFVTYVPAQERLAKVEAERVAARQHLAHRLDAKQSSKDLAYIMNLLLTQRDFYQLPLALWEEGKLNHVNLSELTYTLEKPGENPAVKATFRGPVKGRYEDLRQFIHHLEASDRMLFIEDVDVGRIAAKDPGTEKAPMTMHLQMSTYIRQGSASIPASGKVRPGAKPAILRLPLLESDGA